MAKEVSGRAYRCRYCRGVILPDALVFLLVSRIGLQEGPYHARCAMDRADDVHDTFAEQGYMFNANDFGYHQGPLTGKR